MPSLTPLHETYCIWDSTPPSQADLLEGLAQMLTTPLSDAIPDLIQVIQREILNNWFGMSEYRLKKLQKIRYIDKFHRFSYDSLLNSGHYLLAPLLRQAIEKFPKLHNKSLTAFSASNSRYFKWHFGRLFIPRSKSDCPADGVI